MGPNESRIGEGRTVADVMLRSPKALPADSSVQAVRELFENPRVQMAVLLENGRLFRGALTRDDVEAASPGEPAVRYASAGSPVSPDTPADLAFEQLTRNPARRIVVLDQDGETLLGLVCLNASMTQFCGAPQPL